MAEVLPDVLLVSGRFQIRGSSVQTINLATRLPEAGFRGRIVCSDASLLPPERREELQRRHGVGIEIVGGHGATRTRELAAFANRQRIPYTVLIDRQGKVVNDFEGPRSRAFFRKHFDKLVGSK